MARRPEVTHSRRPVRAPYSDAATAYAAVSSAMNRQADPTPAISARLLVLRELRRALRHERVALGDEGAVLQLARDDHLAPLPERVGDDARVLDRHRAGPLAVT